jgi:NADH/NAD ratio-sensing transcriptional regulator Rex
MTDEPEQKKAGRPAHEFTDEQKDQIERLAEIQCSNKEIAYIMGCSVDTLRRHYTDHVELGKTNGKIKLRRAQWRNAIDDNNTTMQIWLGKNYLGQAESPINTEDNQILPWDSN